MSSKILLRLQIIISTKPGSDLYYKPYFRQYSAMKILAIESSCDETAAAVVENGIKTLSNVIASQVKIHEATGGVMPEVAAREHIKAIMPTINKALTDANVTWDEIDAIAVTKEPGLVGSLVVGRISAAALAYAKNKPLIEVNHIHGHMYSNWLDTESQPEFPVVILTVSGGHNELVLMRGHGDFELLGETMDDAAGEAFDKVARLLRLGYPGGPAIERTAKEGNPKAVEFPRGVKNSNDFSFSGLKTSVLYYLKKNGDKMEDPKFIADTAASFQEAVTDALVDKLVAAVKKYNPKEVHMSGGVSANKYLRARIQERLANLTFRHPQKMSYCTDNAAMIGAAAFFDK